MRIFAGSSEESLGELQEVCSWIEDKDVTIIPWNQPTLFLPGQSTYSRLIELAHSVDAAIFIFGEDDHVWYRQDALTQPRDNVLLEYGLFSAIRGVENTVICRKDSSKTPSDLGGIVVVDISSSRRHAAQKKLVAWASARKASVSSDQSSKANRGLVAFIPKATTGYTKELTEAIQREVNAHLPQAVLTIVPPSNEEHIRPGDIIAALRRRPEVLMITPPPDSHALIPHIIDALKDGIPVITIDDQLAPQLFIEKGLIPPINIACDYEDGGKRAADILLRKLNYKGNVAVISGPKASYSSQVRKLAFIDRLLSASPNISIVSVKETNWNPHAGAERMREILKETENVDAVFCCNDRLALKALEVIEESGVVDNQKIIIVGHDGITEAKEAIRRRGIFATINQHMDQLATLAVEELKYAMNNRKGYVKRHNYRKQLKTSAILYEDLL